jgi:hypothetical protein
MKGIKSDFKCDKGRECLKSLKMHMSTKAYIEELVEEMTTCEGRKAKIREFMVNFKNNIVERRMRNG